MSAVMINADGRGTMEGAQKGMRDSRKSRCMPLQPITDMGFVLDPKPAYLTYRFEKWRPLTLLTFLLT